MKTVSYVYFGLTSLAILLGASEFAVGTLLICAVIFGVGATLLAAIEKQEPK